MYYFISYIDNSDTYLGDGGFEFKNIGTHAHVMELDYEMFDEDGNSCGWQKRRSLEDRSSFAVVACKDVPDTIEGHVLYPVSDFEQIKQDNPYHAWDKMSKMVTENGLIP